MENFDIKYNQVKIYSDSKESKPKNKRLPLPLILPLSLLATILSAKIDLGSLETNIVYIIINNNFDSLYLPCVASKQTYIVVQSKTITKLDGKFNELHVNLWGPHHSASLS